MSVFQVPFGRWSEPDGMPTVAFYRFIVNLFNSTPGAAIANNTIVSNISGGAQAALPNTLTAILDAMIGSTRGQIISRGSAVWGALSLGSTGKALVSDGTDVGYALVASLAAAVTLASGTPASITTAGGDLSLVSATGNVLLGSGAGTVTIGTATGTTKFGQTVSAAAVPANFVANRILAIKDGTGTTFYIPANTATW